MERSPINTILSQSRGPEPEIGMGATVCHYSDRSAATVVGWDGVTLTIQGDRATRVDGRGMSDCQTYDYAPNPDAPTSTWRRDRSGRWVRGYVSKTTNRWRMARGPALVVGIRDAYHDFSF